MKTIYPFLLFLFLIVSGSAQLPFGVNLAGAEFGEEIMPGTYNVEYTYPNEDELDYFQSKGLRLIRLPFRWERIQTTLGGPLNQDELNRIKDFVNLAGTKNMVVLLDLHNYARYRLNNVDQIIGSTNVTLNHIKDLWTKLAQEFHSNTAVWGYGIMNEPNNMDSDTHWLNIAQTIIDGIRSVDMDTKIVVGGDSWSSAERWPDESDNLKTLNDPANNLTFEAHVYFDNDASGQYLGSYDDEQASPSTGITRVQPFIDWLNENNFEGFIGEYGVPDDDDRWLVVLDSFLLHLQDNCINGTYWAAGPWWGDGDDIDHYPLSIEQKNNGADRVQMAVVEKYLSTNCTIVHTPNPLKTKQLQIFPNPTNQFIHFPMESIDGLDILLFDTYGRLMLSQKALKNNTLDLSHFPKGMYTIKILGQQTPYIQQIILE